MAEDEEETVVVEPEVWDGVERRKSDNRREGNDRRGESRDAWERRSGQDRRGHPFYQPRKKSES